MFYLVKFDDDSHSVVHSKHIKQIDGNQCSVKSRGSWFHGYILDKSDCKKFMDDAAAMLEKSSEENTKVRASTSTVDLDPTVLLTDCLTSPNTTALSANLPKKKKKLSKSNNTSETASYPSSGDITFNISKPTGGLQSSTPIKDKSVSMQTTLSISDIHTDASALFPDAQSEESPPPEGMTTIIKFLEQSSLADANPADNMQQSAKSIPPDFDLQNESMNLPENSNTEGYILGSDEIPNVIAVDAVTTPLYDETIVEETPEDIHPELNDLAIEDLDSSHSAEVPTSTAIPLENTQENVGSTTKKFAIVTNSSPSMLVSYEKEPSKECNEQNKDCENSRDVTKSVSDSSYEPSDAIDLEKSEKMPVNDSAATPNSFGLKVDRTKRLDIRHLIVPVSKVDEKRPSKKYFCPYCHTLQTKFARHLRLKHKNENDIKNLVHKSKSEQQKMYTKIRNYGNFIYNSTEEINQGDVIPARRPQAKFNRTTKHFIMCPHCKILIAKTTLRIHNRKFHLDKYTKGSRGQTTEAKKLFNVLHPCASEEMAKNVAAGLNGDSIAQIAITDELIVLYGNRMAETYASEHHYDMIRSHLRLLARFLIEIRAIEENKKTERLRITDLASVFDPKAYNSTVQAVRAVAKYNPQTRNFLSPTNATTLGILLKKCALLRSAECIKSEDSEGKKQVEQFMILFTDDFSTRVNKKALADQTKKRISKTIELPSQEDIQKLYEYVKARCDEAMIVLKSGYKFSSWQALNEGTVVLILMFNRRRPGEAERVFVTNYQSRHSIDKGINPDIYAKLSSKSREQVQMFSLMTIRGKLGRPVPALLHSFIIAYVEMILKFRTEAGVESINEHLFARPHVNDSHKSYIRACPLMRKFSGLCGAQRPDLLRATILRKHIATNTALLRIKEDQVLGLSEHLGHDVAIHKKIYRVSDGVNELTQVSRLLQLAMKPQPFEQSDNNCHDTDDDSDNDDAEDVANTEPTKDRATKEKRNLPCPVVENFSPQPSCSNGRKTNAQVSVENCRLTRKRRRIIVASDSSDDEPDFTPAVSHKNTPEHAPEPVIKSRKRWSAKEIDLATKLFGYPKTIKDLPSLPSCKKAVEENAEFVGRTGMQLRLWFDNRVRASSRKVAYNRTKLSDSL